MLRTLNWHGSVFIDTVGHCAGLVFFGLLILLLYRASPLTRRSGGNLSILAAITVFLWNLAELVAIATAAHPLPISYPAAYVGFCCLTLLPALLLDISLEGRLRELSWLGYLLSGLCITLQSEQYGFSIADRSRLALLVLSSGFVLLSLGAWYWSERHRNQPALRGRTNRVAFLALLIFATSFLHFQPSHTSGLLIGEAIWHHAAIPIALIVLLRDYRFLLLDVFLRFSASALWVAICVGAVSLIASDLRPYLAGPNSGFARGLLLTGICFAVYLLSVSLRKLQNVMTKVAFRRPSLTLLLNLLRDVDEDSEAELVSAMAAEIAAYLATALWSVVEGEVPTEFNGASPALLDFSRPQLPSQPPWATAVCPLRFSRGDSRLLFFGPRNGGRRYLSEDLAALSRIQAALLEHVERFRNDQLMQLAREAELRALQAQINPHFLFNALNTLYGVIGRDSPDARKLVLNLAEVFRARLQSARTFVSLADELQLIRAHLEIESLRLGNRLTSQIVVQPDLDLASISVPALSVQPLVENAVRHGASSNGHVFVRLAIEREGEFISVSVQDHGKGFVDKAVTTGSGVGLENVRARLALCFGPESSLRIQSGPTGSEVCFRVLPLEFKSDARYHGARRNKMRSAESREEVIYRHDVR